MPPMTCWPAMTDVDLDFCRLLSLDISFLSLEGIVVADLVTGACQRQVCVEVVVVEEVHVL